MNPLNECRQYCVHTLPHCRPTCFKSNILFLQEKARHFAKLFQFWRNVVEFPIPWEARIKDMKRTLCIVGWPDDLSLLEPFT